MEIMNEALSLLIVGMIMVFFILLLVIVIGNVVIQLTNRYLPETQQPDNGGVVSRRTDPGKLAAIAAVVDLVTEGRGRVDSLQKK